MGYFSRFPMIEIDGYGVGTDITRRTKIDSEFKTDASVHYLHTIRDGETPEILADLFYDDPQLFWVILMYNEIHNVYEDWPMDQITLDEYVNRKYQDPYGFHHWIAASSGAIVDDSWPSYDRIPVTNIEYETNKNEEKRKIKLVLPELVSQVVRQHNILVAKVQ